MAVCSFVRSVALPLVAFAVSAHAIVTKPVTQHAEALLLSDNTTSSKVCRARHVKQCALQRASSTANSTMLVNKTAECSAGQLTMGETAYSTCGSGSSWIGGHLACMGICVRKAQATQPPFPEDDEAHLRIGSIDKSWSGMSNVDECQDMFCAAIERSATFQGGEESCQDWNMVCELCSLCS